MKPVIIPNVCASSSIDEPDTMTASNEYDFKQCSFLEKMISGFRTGNHAQECELANISALSNESTDSLSTSSAIATSCCHYNPTVIEDDKKASTLNVGSSQTEDEEKAELLESFILQIRTLNKNELDGFITNALKLMNEINKAHPQCSLDSPICEW